MPVETMPNREIYFGVNYSRLLEETPIIIFFPLAWAIVSVENKENCTWFLNLLRDDIEMEGGHGLTLISDQHKRIIETVKDVFSNAEHKQCTRHIYANFIKKFRGFQSKNLFWKAVNSTSKQLFERHMEELKTSSKGAYDHLIERNPITWSRAFFEVGRACDAFENGMSESFNSRIRTAQRKPIISMLEDIRRFVMRRMNYDVIPSGNNIFEARSEKSAYVVKIQEQTCTCGSWQLSGIPCVHTVAALAFLNINPETYVSPWFKKDMFKEAYKHCIKPIKENMHWHKTNGIKPLPPKEMRMPDRPMVKRKRDPLEKKNKNKKVETGRKMTCQNCLGVGHNITSGLAQKEKKDPQPKTARPRGRNKKVESTSVTRKMVD
ncbi:uncharacterized protein LOC143615149 [Bidens hawaiensis]|uniref:uncharacterized protein LOC143615149 n=1 Tax=Bidens hawaiensis TaxID=980011 RepID=UPI004049EB1C